MEGLYNNMELRKLPPRFRTKISQLLDTNEDWKKLMCSIPCSLNPCGHKYKTEHVQLIERHSINTRKSSSEILLDEWSTSGRVRPTVETLYELLRQCELFRAADYVAEEILDVPLPQRPAEGPARRISDTEFPFIPPEHLPDNIIGNTENSNSCNAQTINKLPEQSTRQLNQLGQTERENSEDNKLKTIVDQLNNFDYQSGHLINFSIDCLQAATEDFHQRLNIGSGSFGTVYKLDLTARRSISLAVKLLHPTSSMIEETFVTEINVLSRYRHENLVSLIGYCSNGPQFCLIYEFMGGGTLMEALVPEKTPALPWSKRIDIMLGVIKGIHYLHSALEKPLIHRDIKSANILLSENLCAKIGDFGLAKSFSTTGAQTSALASTIFGTSAYMAPEAFRGDISPKIDVFSFGVILLEVLTGLPPYDEDREGNDIVTYLEESIEDDNIIPWLDRNPGIGELGSDSASSLYSLATKCLTEKKRRLTSDLVLRELQSFLLNFMHYCGKVF